ncbi:MAG TPA: metallophosphoesterase, partial [Clostridia bacterium]|nr:metallophosphoesterase [Clostridia bacterium]
HQELLVKQAVGANPHAVWRVVLMHHSIYGSGGEPNGANLWRFYAPVFDRYGIDLVLSGHDHTHCRTYPIKNNKIVSDGQGVVYLCANSASGSKYGGVPDVTPWYAANSSQLRVPAYTVLGFEENTLTINTYRADTLQATDEEYVMHKQASTGAIPPQSLLMRMFVAVSTVVMVIKASF